MYDKILNLHFKIFKWLLSSSIILILLVLIYSL